MRAAVHRSCSASPRSPARQCLYTILRPALTIPTVSWSPKSRSTETNATIAIMPAHGRFRHLSAKKRLAGSGSMGNGSASSDIVVSAIDASGAEHRWSRRWHTAGP